MEAAGVESAWGTGGGGRGGLTGCAEDFRDLPENRTREGRERVGHWKWTARVRSGDTDPSQLLASGGAGGRADVRAGVRAAWMETGGGGCDPEAVAPRPARIHLNTPLHRGGTWTRSRLALRCHMLAASTMETEALPVLEAGSPRPRCRWGWFVCSFSPGLLCVFTCLPSLPFA